MSDLLEDVPSLPEEEPVFQSSGIAFEVKSEDGHPVLDWCSFYVRTTILLERRAPPILTRPFCSRRVLVLF